MLRCRCVPCRMTHAAGEPCGRMGSAIRAREPGIDGRPVRAAARNKHNAHSTRKKRTCAEEIVSARRDSYAFSATIMHLPYHACLFLVTSRPLFPRASPESDSRESGDRNHRGEQGETMLYSICMKILSVKRTGRRVFAARARRNDLNRGRSKGCLKCLTSYVLCLTRATRCGRVRLHLVERHVQVLPFWSAQGQRAGSVRGRSPAVDGVAVMRTSKDYDLESNVRMRSCIRQCSETCQTLTLGK